MPTDILRSGTENSGSVSPGITAPENATPRVRVLAFARCAIAVTASRSSPRSAAAAAHFHTNRPPAMPRRRCGSNGPALEMSSVTVTVLAALPELTRAASAASKLSTSPA